jgi:hypothetical protein
MNVWRTVMSVGDAEDKAQASDCSHNCIYSSSWVLDFGSVASLLFLLQSLSCTTLPLLLATMAHSLGGLGWSRSPVLVSVQF